MSALDWSILAAAGASAGVYAAALVLVAAKRWPVAGLPFPAILTAAALFALARNAGGAPAIATIAALFLCLALAQTLRSTRTDAFAKLLALVPLFAMLLVTIAQLTGSATQAAFQASLTIVLCLPAPIAIAFGLRNLDLIRKAALDRVG
jgi:hypothetical protein